MWHLKVYVEDAVSWVLIKKLPIWFRWRVGVSDLVQWEGVSEAKMCGGGGETKYVEPRGWADKISRVGDGFLFLFIYLFLNLIIVVWLTHTT